MNQVILKVLCGAKEKISDEHFWTQEYVAKNIKDIPVSYSSKGASKFSLHGAILRAGVESSFLYNGRHLDLPRSTAIMSRIQGLFSMILNNRNDVHRVHYKYDKTQSHKEVIDLLDEAIEFVKSSDGEESESSCNHDWKEMKKTWDELYERCSICDAKCYTDLLPSRWDGKYRKLIIYYDEVLGTASNLEMYHIIDGEDIFIEDPNEY